MKNNLSKSKCLFYFNIFIILTIFFISIIISSCSHIKPAPIKENIDAIIIDEMAKQNIVGLALGIVSNDGHYYTKGYGHEDLARTKLVTQNTVFRWASISKVLTATAALKLDEKKTTFSINDKVTKHVTYWPKTDNKGDILIKHLLSHRSGIIHFDKKENCPDNPKPEYEKSKHTDGKYNAVQAVDVFKEQELCFKPGENSKYSNFGFNLLGSAIEEISRKGYVDYVNKRIRDPLGMKSLRPATESKSKGFKQECQILKNKSSGSLLYILPGGGWESNIIDLAKFANGIINGNILNDTSRLWTTVNNNIIYQKNYGYGIFHEDNKNKIWHGGKLDDVKTLLYLYPNSYEKLGIVLIVNGGGYVNVERVSFRLAELFGKKDHSYNENPIVHDCDTDDDCPGKFSGVWRETGKDVLLRRGYSHYNFFKEWEFLRNAGYFSDDFEPYVQNGQVLWDAVFRKGSGSNPMWRDLDKDEFYKKWIEQKAHNTHLVDIETYVTNGKRKWSGLFRSGSGKNDIDWYLSTDEFHNKWNEMRDNGYKLIDIEVYNDDDGLRWAGVWIEGKDGKLNRDFTHEKFIDLVKQRNMSGWRLIDIERYLKNGKVRWAGIWEKSSNKEALYPIQSYCGTKDFQGNQLSWGIVHHHNELRKKGFELIDWEYQND